jgi:flagellar basal body-associated protein FliL
MNKSKLILIIGSVLIVISIVLSTVSVIMVSSALKKISSTEQNANTNKEPDEIPITQITTYQMTKNITLTLMPDESTNKRLNVVLEISVGFDSKNKDASKKIAVLTEKEDIIRDSILKLLQTKTPKDFDPSNTESTEKIQQEILTSLSKQLDTDSIVKVYFSNILRSYR